MKSKITVFGAICLFLLSGFTMITAVGYSQEYPDLIPKLYLEKSEERNYYDIYIEVHNIGDVNAYFPAGSIIARLESIYKIFPKTVITNHKENNDLVLEPGEIYRDYAGTDFYINLKGAKFILTVDPNNVVYEGEDGEKNNVLEEIMFPRTRHHTFSLFSGMDWILEQYPNSFQILRNLLGLR